MESYKQLQDETFEKNDHFDAEDFEQYLGGQDDDILRNINNPDATESSIDYSTEHHHQR